MINVQESQALTIPTNLKRNQDEMTSQDEVIETLMVEMNLVKKRLAHHLDLFAMKDAEISTLKKAILSLQNKERHTSDLTADLIKQSSERKTSGPVQPQTTTSESTKIKERQEGSQEECPRTNSNIKTTSLGQENSGTFDQPGEPQYSSPTSTLICLCSKEVYPLVHSRCCNCYPRSHTAILAEDTDISGKDNRSSLLGGKDSSSCPSPRQFYPSSEILPAGFPSGHGMQPTIDLSVPPGHCGDLYPGRSTEHSDSGHNGFGYEGLVDPTEVVRGEGYNSTRPSLPQELFPAAPPSCSPWVLSGGADDDLGQGSVSSCQALANLPPATKKLWTTNITYDRERVKDQDGMSC